MKGAKDKKKTLGSVSQPRKGSKIDEDIGDTRDDFDNIMNNKVLKPDDQLVLTESQLKEEFTRILTATNPHAPQNIVRFNFKEMQYKPVPQVDQLAVHFSLEGNLLHKESDEGRKQLMKMGKILTEVPEVKEEKTEEDVPTSLDEGEESGEPKEGVPEIAATPDKLVSVPSTGGGEGEKKLTNQFNFCDRASQTYNNPARERDNMTEPPPRSNFSDNVTQWHIYDSYIEDFEKQQLSKEKKTTTFGSKVEEKSRKKLTSVETAADEMSKIGKPIKIVERMVNQNTFDDISQDFKYYEDPSDEYRDQVGTLLPLWKFTYDKAKKIAVTSVAFSHKYFDLFAVGHGSYDFMKQTNTGLICLYSLKNPSYPEYVFETPSGVLCLDLHKGLPYMICAGLYDGSVAVYSVMQQKRPVLPLYVSTARTHKHTDPVWEVKWQREDYDNNLNFYSVSGDGRVSSWTLIKEGVGRKHECSNDIVCHDIIEIKLTEEVCQGPEGASLLTLSSGTCFSFSSQNEHLFLVGTEEGLIHKCSKAYSSQFLRTYRAHHMAVYKVGWNTFHPDVFISCSADWTIRIWDHNKSDPQFVFDVGSPVGDVVWSPYSSTVFAAATADGRILVYDLNINKYEPICEQMIASKKKTRLTHIAFNPKHPILLVGDDRGQIISLKLSPNLRKMPKEKKGLEQTKGPEAEVQKLDKILSLVG